MTPIIVPDGYQIVSVDGAEDAVFVEARSASGETWRSSVCPDDDISTLPVARKAQIQALWTQERVAAYEASIPVEQPLTSADYAAALQSHIDATARAHEYGSGELLASYINSTVPAWAAEAAAFVAWRDAVWLASYAELAAVQSGAHPAPTIEAFIAGLPAITWPA